jgi:hypothetical protein
MPELICREPEPALADDGEGGFVGDCASFAAFGRAQALEEGKVVIAAAILRAPVLTSVDIHVFSFSLAFGRGLGCGSFFVGQERLAHFFGALGACGHFGPRRFGTKAAVAHIVERRCVGVGPGLCGSGQVNLSVSHACHFVV